MAGIFIATRITGKGESMAKTPQQMLQNWQQGMQQGGQKWIKGIGEVQDSPAQLAVANKGKMVANWNAVMNSTAWDQAMGAVTLAFWKQQCNAALQKFQLGAQKGQAKYQKFAQQAQPVYAAMKMASKQAVGPIAKVTAALQVLLAAGRKQGGNAFI